MQAPARVTHRRDMIDIHAEPKHSCVYPIGVGHNVFRTKLCKNRVEMFDVEYFEVDHHRREIGSRSLHADVVDVAVMLGNDLGDLRKRSGLVHRLQRNAGREALRRALIDVPAQIKPALRRILEIFQRRGLDWIDRNALAGGEDSHDPVTG